MAVLWLRLIAQQARHLLERESLCFRQGALCCGCLQMGAIDGAELLVVPCARRLTSRLWVAKVAKMPILDAVSVQGGGECGLREARASRDGNGADIDKQGHLGLLKGAEDVGQSCALVAKCVERSGHRRRLEETRRAG